MNIMTIALDTIKNTIPPRVLSVSFSDPVANYRQAPISITESIMAKVIRPRVLVAANLVGGEEVSVMLSKVKSTTVDMFTRVFEIPPELLMGRTILSVLSINYLPVGLGVGYYGALNGSSAGSSSVASNVSNRVMNAASTIPHVSTASADLVGHNTVIVRDRLYITNHYRLRCQVCNDENLNNINPRSYLAFADLCVFAVKAYIYNFVREKIESGELSGGQELGIIKNTIDSYSDAEENYKTYLREKWAKIAYMNDSVAYMKYLRSSTSPGV